MEARERCSRSAACRSRSLISAVVLMVSVSFFWRDMAASLAMTANVLPFHDRLNAKRLFLASCQQLNAAGSKTVHTVAEMLAFCFAEVADPTEEIIEGIPVIAGQRVGGVFRYFDETF